MTTATTATARPLFVVPPFMSSSSSSPIIEPMVGRMLRSRKTRWVQQYPNERSKSHAVPFPTFSYTTTTHTLSPPPPTRTSTRASIRVTTSIVPKPSATTKPKSAAVLVVPAKTTGSEGETIGRWETWERMAFLRSVRVHGRGNWKAIAEDIPTRTAIQVKSHAQVILPKPNIFRELDEYDKAQKTAPKSKKRRHPGPAATRKVGGSHAKKPKPTHSTVADVATTATTTTKMYLRSRDKRSKKRLTDASGITFNISTDDKDVAKKGNSSTKSNSAASVKRATTTRSSWTSASSSFTHSQVFSSSHHVTVTMTMTGTMGVTTTTKPVANPETPSFKRSSSRSFLTTMPTPPTVPFSSSFEIGFMDTRSSCLPTTTSAIKVTSFASFHSQALMTTSEATKTFVEAPKNEDEKHEAARALLRLATSSSCIYGD